MRNASTDSLLDRLLCGVTLASVKLAEANLNQRKLMKKITSIPSLIFVVAICSVMAPANAATAAKAEAKPAWKVAGELEEACSCRPACPCWFKSLPSRMTCDGAQIIFIKKGHYGKIPPEGLAVAQFVQGPEHPCMSAPFAKWNC